MEQKFYAWKMKMHFRGELNWVWTHLIGLHWINLKKSRFPTPCKTKDLIILNLTKPFTASWHGLQKYWSSQGFKVPQCHCSELQTLEVLTENGHGATLVWTIVKSFEQEQMKPQGRRCIEVSLLYTHYARVHCMLHYL